MRKLLIIGFLFINILLTMAQAKKPTIMVVPSDGWCHEKGFEEIFDNQGKKIISPDYRRALRENSEINTVIIKLGELMKERGFPLKDLEQSLKSLESESAEDAMLTSKSGSNVEETSIDKLKKVSKADIIMQVYWKLNISGPRKSIEFQLKGLDSYSNKQIAAASGVGPQSFTSEIAILLNEAVLTHIDNFNSQLQSHFDDLFANGRETTLRIKKFESYDGDLETEINGEELGSLIEKWISENTVKGRFSTTDATENMMFFEQVRIPLYDANNKAIDTREWAKGLQKYLKTLNVTSKLMTKGLGQASLVIGDK
jgi:hypothetical protein